MRETKLPTYEQALNALRNGDHDILDEALFAVEIDDGWYIEKVSEAVQELLTRPGGTEEQQLSIRRALLGLKRLPLRTAGLDVEILLNEKIGTGAESYRFYISADNFSTTMGGYDNFGFGTDSYSKIYYEVEPQYRDDECWEPITWVIVFREMTKAKLVINDDSDASLLDGEEIDVSPFWEWIDKNR